VSRYQRLRAKNAQRASAGRGAFADEGDRGSGIARAAQLATRAPHLMREDDVASLQASAGNKALQRALSFNKSDWSKTQYLDASSGGGGGVLFAGEKGPEVVVKPGEDLPAEGALAAFLINQVSAAGGTGFGLAPGYRVPSKSEKQQIKAAFTPLVGKAGQKQRVADLVAKLDEAGVVIQDMAQGRELKDVVQSVPKHTKKKLFGGGQRKLRKNSPMRIFTDARSVHALGSVTAVDLFTGNRDRVFQFNWENMMVSPYSLSMIDNIWMGTEASYFRTQTVTVRGGAKQTITVDDALKAWKQDFLVKQFAAGDYDKIADYAFERIRDEGSMRLTRPVDKRGFEQAMNSSKDMFVSSFSAGLQAGKKQLFVSLGRLSYKDFHNMVQGVGVAEFRRTIKRRQDFLSGRG
jgi:hypothetical protein